MWASLVMPVEAVSALAQRGSLGHLRILVTNAADYKSADETLGRQELMPWLEPPQSEAGSRVEPQGSICRSVSLMSSDGGGRSHTARYWLHP